MSEPTTPAECTGECDPTTGAYKHRPDCATERQSARRGRYAAAIDQAPWARAVERAIGVADAETADLCAALEQARAERDALLAELGGRDEEARERWIQKQLDETGIRSVDFRNGMHMDVEPARELLAHWVAAARTMLGDAPNYSETKLEMDVKVAESPELYTLVIQRHAPGALTPHEARKQAEAERDETAARAATVISAMGADIRAGRKEAARYRLAWQSARKRAAAYGLTDGLRSAVRVALEQHRRADRAEAERDALREQLAALTAGVTGDDDALCSRCGGPIRWVLAGGIGKGRWQHLADETGLDHFAQPATDHTTGEGSGRG